MWLTVQGDTVHHCEIDCMRRLATLHPCQKAEKDECLSLVPCLFVQDHTLYTGVAHIQAISSHFINLT